MRIQRFRGIRNSLPFACSATTTSYSRGREAGREARGRAAVCLERVCARPTMPAMPHDRSGASLGKSKIYGFENLVVRFGPPLPFLALSCVQSSPMSGTLRFSQNLSRIIVFRVPEKRETDPDDTGWPRGPLPMVHVATTITGPLKTSKIIKNH